MKIDLVTSADVSRAWGYNTGQDNVRRFLEKNATAVASAALGGRTVVLYERSAALGLSAAFKQYLAEVREKNRRQCGEMGKKRQAELRAAGNNPKGLGASTASIVHTVRQRLDELETRLAYLETELNVKR